MIVPHRLKPGILLALWLAAPAAMAAIYPYSADTISPVRRQGAVMAGGINWNCAGSQCTATSTSAVPTVAACHALAQQVGPVRGYGHQKRTLTAGELQQCNAGIATGQSTAMSTTTLVRAPQPVTPARGPVVINTAPLQYAGRGSVMITTESLRYAGRGPVSITTDTLRYAGRGPVTINTETLRYAGRGPVVINTDPLRYAGRGPVTIGTDPLTYRGPDR